MEVYAASGARCPHCRSPLNTLQGLTELGIPCWRALAGFEEMVATAARVQKPICMQERTGYLYVGIPDQCDPTKMQTCWFDTESGAFHQHDGEAFNVADVRNVQLLDADGTRLCSLLDAIEC